MIDGPISADDVVVHLRTNGSYIVAGTGLLKVGDSKDWTPSVVYHKPGESQMFTRDDATFRQNFARIEDAPAGVDASVNAQALAQECGAFRFVQKMSSDPQSYVRFTDAQLAAFVARIRIAGVALPRVTQLRDCPCGVDCFRSDCTDTRCGIWADREKAASGVSVLQGEVIRTPAPDGKDRP